MTSKSRLLEGKIALVTGSSRGIGRSIVERFASEGATVYANCRTSGSFDIVAQELSKLHGVEVVPLYYDVTDPIQTKEAFSLIMKERKRLDVLINNAGIMEDALIGMITNELMQRIFNTNVFAVINHLQLAARLMKRAKAGSIINLSSVVGIDGVSGQLVYSASKGAVATLTRSAAKELAGDNIRVNAIAPGIIETDLLSAMDDTLLEKRKTSIGLGRFGTPAEIAESALFLASDLSRYITGQILGVDGGVVI
jgi:3-oxoacyl-[acyl-carrier protein] reductase